MRIWWFAWLHIIVLLAQVALLITVVTWHTGHLHLHRFICYINLHFTKDFPLFPNFLILTVTIRKWISVTVEDSSESSHCVEHRNALFLLICLPLHARQGLQPDFAITSPSSFSSLSYPIPNPYSHLRSTWTAFLWCLQQKMVHSLVPRQMWILGWSLEDQMCLLLQLQNFLTHQLLLHMMCQWNHLCLEGGLYLGRNFSAMKKWECK